MENETEKEVRVVSRKKPVTVKLLEPIEWGDETIKEVTLKPPRGKHIKTLPTPPAIKDMINLGSKLSGISVSVFDEMCSEDVLAIVTAVGELL